MRTRELPPAEWDRLDRTGLPELLQHVRPEDVVVVVVESDEGAIVGSMAVLRVVHLEGAWIDPEAMSAGVTRALIRGSVDAARRWTGAGWAFGGAEEGNEPMRDILVRLGGARVPVETFALSLEGR